MIVPAISAWTGLAGHTVAGRPRGRCCCCCYSGALHLGRPGRGAGRARASSSNNNSARTGVERGRVRQCSSGRGNFFMPMAAGARPRGRPVNRVPSLLLLLLLGRPPPRSARAGGRQSGGQQQQQQQQRCGAGWWASGTSSCPCRRIRRIAIGKGGTRGRSIDGAGELIDELNACAVDRRSLAWGG